MKSYNKKHKENEYSLTDKKLTIPEIYPNNRLIDCKTPITSDENVESAKEWVEFNKL